MKLYPKDGRFKCFGCGKSGSTIDLYASAGSGMGFGEAVKEMKSRYLGIIDGQPGPPRRLARAIVAKAEVPITPDEEFSPIYLALQTFCRQHSPTNIKHQAFAYLKERAFSLETIKHFGLFVIPDIKATSDFLTSTYSLSQLEASGLFSPKTEKSKGGFMFYKHPIIIPYLKDGQIVNLQGRCIGKPVANGWKYQYLRERPPMTMFNQDALLGLEKGSKVYLTEGAFDTMAAYQKGGTAVSINSATLFKPEWVKLFVGLKVCFMLDSDKAGQKAIENLRPLFWQADVPISMKSLPAGCKDVNEWLIKWSGHVNGYPAFWDQ
jgi:DNA primase